VNSAGLALMEVCKGLVKRRSPERAATAALRRNQPFAGWDRTGMFDPEVTFMIAPVEPLHRTCSTLSSARRA
jgi:hypothetical protein